MIALGELINDELKIYKKIGSGGFGEVFLAYSKSLDHFIAIKTFRQELLSDPSSRERFNKEILTWINIEYHPNIVKAYTVYKPITGGTYLGLEFIPPNELGLNTLAQHLTIHKLTLDVIINWSIQICFGMEHLKLNGIRCHRDIKPSNIMIDPNNLVKITDLGLVDFFENQIRAKYDSKISAINYLLGDTVTGSSFGTPMYMSPEQFENAKKCDERSDIYSFGIVLYQMISARAPFDVNVLKGTNENNEANYFQKFYLLHKYQIPPILDSKLDFIVMRCLQKNLEDRYQNFTDLRFDLENLNKNEVSCKVYIPNKEIATGTQLNNKGLAFIFLGLFDQAIPVFIKAMEEGCINEYVYMNIGIAFYELGKYKEALKYFDLSLGINAHNKKCLNNKARCLIKLNRYDEAVKYADLAISMDKKYANAYNNRGLALMEMKLYDEAYKDFQAALEIEPNFVAANNNTAVLYIKLNKLKKAFEFFNKVLSIDPLDVTATFNLGKLYYEEDKKKLALKYFEKVIELDRNYVKAWFYQGIIFQENSDFDKAILSYNEVLNRKNDFFTCWIKLGVCYDNVVDYKNAIKCFDRAISLAPTNSNVWFLKAITLEKMKNTFEAIKCYKEFLELEKDNENSEFIEYAKKTVEEFK